MEEQEREPFEWGKYIIGPMVGIMFGALVAYYSTVADLKIVDAETKTNIAAIIKRIEDLEDDVKNFDVNGSRKVGVLTVELESLRKANEALTQRIERLSGQLEHHDETTKEYYSTRGRK